MGTLHKYNFPGEQNLFSIKRMKRTFCLLATMAFFAFPGEGHAAKDSSPKKSPPPKLKQLRLEYFEDFINEAAAKEKLEASLLRAIIRVESNFNHKALSRVGAKGLMQLMPFTADALGNRKALDFTNPRANILAGAHYLREMINKFNGDLPVAIAAYNAGPTAVNKYKGIPPFRETRDYVAKVTEMLTKEREQVLSN
jgi:soluble lytic murein transglycosylase-like protein